MCSSAGATKASIRDQIVKGNSQRLRDPLEDGDVTLLSFGFDFRNVSLSDARLPRQRSLR
jgi:hypothetical protein